MPGEDAQDNQLERRISYGVGGAGNVRHPSKVAQDAALRAERKVKKAAERAAGGGGQDEGNGSGKRRRSSVMRLLGRRSSDAGS